MKKLYTYLDNLVLLLTNLLFSVVPVVMILAGGFTLIAVMLRWYFNQQIVLSNIWLIVIGLLISWMGFKWDDVVIENYPTALERKKAGYSWQKKIK